MKNVDFWSVSDNEKKSDTLPARLASSELQSVSPDQRCAGKLLSFENQNKNLVFIKLFLFKSQHFVKFLIGIRNLMGDSSWSRADGSHYWWKMYMFNKTNKSRCVPKMRSNGGCQRCERALHCPVTLTTAQPFSITFRSEPRVSCWQHPSHERNLLLFLLRMEQKETKV